MNNLYKLWLAGLLTLALDVNADTPHPPINLAQALDYALANNPELSIMQERIEQARNQLGLAMANFYPQVKASLAYQHTNNPAEAFAMIIAQRRLDFAGTDFNHPGGTDNYRPQLTATYSLISWRSRHALEPSGTIGY